jgi:hypothetical protein
MLEFADVGVAVGNGEVSVAVVYVPDAEDDAQVLGRLLASGSPQDAGTTPARAAAAVKKAAYDQVRS